MEALFIGIVIVIFVTIILIGYVRRKQNYKAKREKQDAIISEEERKIK